MLAYVIRRLLLIIPTLLAILIVNFLIVQSTTGVPVELFLTQIQDFSHNCVSAASA